MGFLFGIKKHEAPIKVPDLSDIHIFVRELFVKAQLTAECSIAAHGTGSCSFGRKNLAALSLVRIVIGVEGVARFKFME
eukprot:gene13515-9670_t